SDLADQPYSRAAVVPGHDVVADRVGVSEEIDDPAAPFVVVTGRRTSIRNRGRSGRVRPDEVAEDEVRARAGPVDEDAVVAVPRDDVRALAGIADRVVRAAEQLDAVEVRPCESRRRVEAEEAAGDRRPAVLGDEDARVSEPAQRKRVDADVGRVNLEAVDDGDTRRDLDQR